MKRVWLMLLVILMIFTLISCSNGKNGATKEVTTIKEESIQEQKFEIEPYSWVRRDNLKENNIYTEKGSWLGYEKMNKNMKEVWKDSKKGERPILYIEIISEISNNLTRIPRSIRSDPTECEYVKLRDNQYLMFNKYNRSTTRSDYKLFYTSDGEMIRKDVNIICKIVPRGIAFSATFDNDNIYLTYNNTLMEIDKNYFNDILTDEKVEYYIHHDLFIDEVDVYGNIKGRYGEEEFIIGPKGKWESKLIENSIPRKYFKYDWPEYKDDKWEYKNKPEITIKGFDVEILNQGTKYEGTTFQWKEGFDLETDDPFLIEKAKEKKSYNSTEIKEVIKYIQQKYPEKDINLNYDADQYSIKLSSYKGNLKNELPTIGNPKFVTQVKIINHGWMVYYY